MNIRVFAICIAIATAARADSPDAPGSPKVIILDTGLARRSNRPGALNSDRITAARSDTDAPDEDEDRDLDPAAGHGTFIAGVIDHRLALARENWPGLRPTPGFERPMILTTMRWFSAARLAHSLLEAGFAVSTCRPRGLRRASGLRFRTV